MARFIKKFKGPFVEKRLDLDMVTCPSQQGKVLFIPEPLTGGNVERVGTNKNDFFRMVFERGHAKRGDFLRK